MMRRFGKRRGFELALAHGSYDLAMAARSLGIPEANMHDYEFAITQHRIACRLASRVIFPDTVPAERLRRFGVGPEKLLPVSGAEGGVLPRRLRARPRRARAARRRHAARRGHRQAAARRLAVPPQVESAVSPGPLPPRSRRPGPRRRPAPYRRPAKPRGEPRPAVGDRRRADGRGAEPGRARRSRRFGRRDDEPRGGGAGNAGLHHLRRQARRRRRGADSFRTPAATHRPRAPSSSRSEAPAMVRRPSATPRCSSTSSWARSSRGPRLYLALGSVGYPRRQVYRDAG